MRLVTPIRWRRWLPCLIALAVLLPNSGCLVAALGVAGAAGAGAGGYMYLQGNVQHDYNADFENTWNASQLALKELGLPVLKAERNKEGGGTILSQTGDGDSIKIELEPRAARIPAEGQWTHLGVRVAFFGDQAISERIIHQIDSHLVPVAPGGPLPVQTGPPPMAGH